ncbi:MAG: ACT domain-containing protein [Eubacteriales bacterium]
MRAVVTVTGKDRVGIIAAISGECSRYGVNIEDISQSVMQEYFAMIMLAELDGMTMDFTQFVAHMEETGRQKGLDVRVMHEDVFNAMHRI